MDGSGQFVSPWPLDETVSAPPGCLSWRLISLSERRDDINCLVDADDFEWLSAWRWNIGWHAKTKWKLYGKRNEGPARSTVYMHRAILIRASGCDEDFAAAHHGHHLNSQSLDNRKANLAWATPAQNSSIRVRRAAIPSIDAIVAQLAREAAKALIAADIPW